MKQWIIAVALASTALFITPATVAADDGTRLFKDWHYGQHIDSFPRSQGYYDCSDDVGVLALCHDDVTFLEYPFYGQLMFNDDDQLVHVTVSSYYSDDLYATLVGALVRSFTMIFAEGPDDTFDMVQHVQQGTFSDESSMQAAVGEFEVAQLRQGFFGMVMVEQSGLRDTLDADSWQELVLELSADTRAADVYVYEDDWGAWLDASFYLPGRQRERVIEQAEQAPVEDF